jgi:hypothetical protein
MVEVTNDPADVETFLDIQQSATEWSESEGLKWSISLNQLTTELENRGAVRGRRVRVDVLERGGWNTKQTSEWHGLRLGPFDD